MITTIPNRPTKPSTVLLKKKRPDLRERALFLLDQAELTGADLSGLMNDVFNKTHFERRDQALITTLVYGVFRQRALLDWWIDQFSRVKRVKKTIRFILRLALYQVAFLDRIPGYAIVNSAVNLAKTAGGAGAGRFVNGLLRNVMRQDTLPQPDTLKPLQSIAISTSHPLWMVKRWFLRWGEAKTREFCQFNTLTPPMTLRVNRLKTNREDLMAELIQEGGSVAATSLSPDALTVKGLSVASLATFERGEFYVQDEGAQLTAYLLGAKSGECILDFCAAPGGKTTHLAELTYGKAEIIATDSSAHRLLLLKENVSRLKSPNIKVVPLAEVLAEDRQYDRILVDAPCSALGILRRIPEGKWSKKAKMIQEYALIQLEILNEVLPLLKSGGHLLYITCSTEREENEAVVETFSLQHSEIQREDLSESLPVAARKYVDASGCFTTAFNSDNMDRFFAVRWRKME